MKFFQSKLVFSLLIFLSILVGCQSTQQKPEKQKVKNIILMIGDGMGPAYIKAYRLFKDDPETEIFEMTTFDKHLVGTLDTHPKGTNEKVTDSAAAATAYATGKKVPNRTLSITDQGEELLTVLEKAKQLGKSTGIVVTSPLTGATPAAFVAHHPSRYEYAKIADQFFDNQFGSSPYVDVMLGGGKNNFVREDRNLTKEFKSKGYNYVVNKEGLLNNTQEKMIGIFAKEQLDKMMDRKKETPSLAEMTNAAIKQLSKNKKGFFLMIEASQIDWAGHRKDIVGAMSEMQDFELALKEVIEFAKSNSETQVILTADHSTGGLSIGSEVKGKKYYDWNSDVIRSFTKTPEEIAVQALIAKDLYSAFIKASSMEIYQDEVATLKSFTFPEELMNIDIKGKSESKIENALVATITNIINDHSYTGWTTRGHTGVDVNLYAYGPRSAELAGHHDNTKIGQFIFNLLNE
ncbi:MAG: alkaline phosphatase [Kangiellaceae bacterium]